MRWTACELDKKNCDEFCHMCTYVFNEVTLNFKLSIFSNTIKDNWRQDKIHKEGKPITEIGL